MNVPEPFTIFTKHKHFPIRSFNSIPHEKITILYKNSILASDIKLANIFGAEMVLSNYYSEFWDSTFQIWLKYIHLNNVNLFLWIMIQYKKFNKIRKKNYINDLKNIQEVRHIVAQITTFLCLEEKDELVVSEKAKRLRLSRNSRDIAKYFYCIARAERECGSEYGEHDGRDGERLVLYLAQFIEAYNQDIREYLYYRIKLLINIDYQIKNIKDLKVAKNISTEPVILVWLLTQNIAEKKNIDLSVISELRQVFGLLLGKEDFEYALLCSFIMVIFVKNNGDLSLKTLNVLDRTVIKNVLSINYVYRNIHKLIGQYYSGKTAEELAKEEEELQIILDNAGKQRERPKVIEVGDGQPNTMKFSFTPN